MMLFSGKTCRLFAAVIFRCRVRWVYSRLFWRICGAYSLLSAAALCGLLLAQGRELEQQFRQQQTSRIKDTVHRVRELIESGQDPATAIQSTQAVSRSEICLWYVSAAGEAEAGGPLAFPKDITTESVIRTAMLEGSGFRTVRVQLTDAEPRTDCFVCAERVSPDSNARGSVVLGLSRSEHADSESSSLRSVTLQTAVTVWLCGFLCMCVVAAGVVGPLQSMSVNLKNTADQSQRENMLLTISDRLDELGQVAGSLHELEEDRQNQISQLQLTERRARSSADLLTTVLDSMIEGVIAIDLEQRIVFLNAASRQLLGIGSVIGVGNRLYEAVRMPAFLETVQAAMDSEEQQSLEYRSIREQTDQMMVSIPIPKGPYAGAVIVVRDISELRRMEAMRRDFVSGVSHELKTPLTVIQACTETLLNGALEDSSAALRFLKQIDEQSERLLQLILSMLQLARVESGQLVLRPERVDVTELIRDVCTSFQTVADSAGIRLILATEGACSVVIDQQALRTILNNLVDNALKYSPAGGMVRLSLMPGRNEVTVSVSDTGSGIPEELLGRIFERFYRVERDRSRNRGGSGLGLAIVKHLCQAIGARISVRSIVGSGSDFRVTLPVEPPNR